MQRFSPIDREYVAPPMPEPASTAIHIMRELRPPYCCYDCAHQDCMRKRREAALPCLLCGKRIEAGKAYRVAARKGPTMEVVSQLCLPCERRKIDR